MQRPPARIIGTLGFGLVLCFAVFAAIRNWEARDFEKRTGDRVEQQLAKLRVSMLRSIEVLYSVISLYATDGRIEREQFRAFVRHALERQPELLALSWNPVVPLAGRENFEREAGVTIRESNSDGQLVRAVERPELVPVCFIEPMAGNEAARGYDLSSDAKRRESIECARDTGQATGTALVRLAQGPKDNAGFLVVLPAFAGEPPRTVSDRRRQIAGYAVAVFRVTDLVSGVFAELQKNGIDVELRDVSADGALIHSTVRGKLTRFATTELEFAEHRWTLRYAPSPSFSARSQGFQSWIALIAGLAFTGMATAYLLAGWRRAEEVGEAMAALDLEVGERRRAERAAAAANKAKSDFLANMSHEIRTPLNAILGYAQSLQRDPHLAPEQRDSAWGIRMSGQHLLGLINEVLDLSKIEAGRMELHPTDFELHSFANTIARTFRPLCAQKRIGLRITVEDAGRKHLRGDEAKLRQIIINLLGNAVKFTTIGEVFFGVSALKDGTWRFEVIDTGLGIREEERGNIFEPFHQGKGAQHQVGTGLGLAIARRQVELMGGKLEFESQRGIGTRFFFSIELPDAIGVEAPQDLAEATAREDAKADEIAPINLPEELCGRLMIAAELHSATALKACLRELREHGPEASRLADAIRQLMRGYNMEGIQRLLAQASGVGRAEVHHGTSGH